MLFRSLHTLHLVGCQNLVQYMLYESNQVPIAASGRYSPRFHILPAGRKKAPKVYPFEAFSLSKMSRPADMCGWTGHLQGNGALRVCEPPCGECAVQRSILSPGGYQGERISAARLRAEMGSPWSVSLLRHAKSPEGLSLRGFLHCIWSCYPDLNWRPHPYQGCALPTEL